MSGKVKYPECGAQFKGKEGKPFKCGLIPGHQGRHMRWLAADIFIKESHQDYEKRIRKAALDDCKTLLERVLSENPFKQNEENNEYCSWYDAIDKALAELEALKNGTMDVYWSD